MAGQLEALGMPFARVPAVDGRLVSAETKVDRRLYHRRHGRDVRPGEIGCYLVSDGSAHPYRVRVRPPSLINLQALRQMCIGHLVADVVAIIGTLDIVLGEIDR